MRDRSMAILRKSFISSAVLWPVGVWAVWGLFFSVIAPGGLFAAEPAGEAGGIDLLKLYPTSLEEGCMDPTQARAWEFGAEDIFLLSGFTFRVGEELVIESGEADLGIGHCADGAVWAVVLPRGEASLKSRMCEGAEAVDHIWLRFHPKTIGGLFSPATVKSKGDPARMNRMRRIQSAKMLSSLQAGGKALIPPPKIMTVDVETQAPLRRLFLVDVEAGTANYMRGFAELTVKSDTPLSRETAESVFDTLWERYDREYAMFAIRPQVDWDELRRVYRPKAAACQSASELAVVFAEMLSHLEDLHIKVSVNGQPVMVYSRERAVNANSSAREVLVSGLRKAGRLLSWGITADRVGYIAVDAWQGDVAERFEEAMEEMRDTRGLVIDVRLNGGGSETLAQNAAGRFADQPYVYAYSRYRNGPEHTDLTERSPHEVRPRGPWRYDRPVIVLIGSKCVSSNESFISMMAECPQVTTMGDLTCGSSGNPQLMELPGNIRVSLPVWIRLLPDGEPLEGRGIRPDAAFPTEAEYFGEGRDDLLKEALARLAKESLPETAIAGPDVRVLKAKEKTLQPRVVQVFPGEGAEEVEEETEIRIRFDGAMDPLMTSLLWKEGGCLEFAGSRYDGDRCEFIFSVRLEAGCKHTLAVNEQPAFLGFCDPNGNTADSFTWSFRTKGTGAGDGGERPRIVSVTPEAGTALPLVSELQVRFDRAMAADAFDVLDGSGQSSVFSSRALKSEIRYDADRQTFTIPLVLPPKWAGQVKLTGFKSAEGVPAEAVVLDYSAGGTLLSEEIERRLNRMGPSEALLRVLEKAAEVRRNTRALSETVVTAATQRNSIGSCYALFRLEGDRRFHADISRVMRSPFHIGSDGASCWYYNKHKDRRGEVKELLEAISSEDVHEKNILIADPFGVTQTGAEEVIRQYRLETIESASLGGRLCHRLRSWHIEQAAEAAAFNILRCHVSRWWIDAETYRLLLIEDDWGNSRNTIQFLYETDEGGFGSEDFSYARLSDNEASAPAPLDEKYDRRFLNAIDGSNGRMSVRWGRLGPEGKSSSGLN